MGQRLDLHQVLKTLPGVSDAYFQPPLDVTMTYPCIVYERSESYVSYADNLKYWRKKRYSVTVIDRNPDSEIVDAVEELPYTRFERFFVTQGLNHTVFQTFF